MNEIIKARISLTRSVCDGIKSVDSLATSLWHVPLNYLLWIIFYLCYYLPSYFTKVWNSLMNKNQKQIRDIHHTYHHLTDLV